MKRGIGFIAATLLTASVYSQNYSGSSNSATDPDSTPDYRSRQSESGSPPVSQSSVSAGYDRAPGLSGGNSSIGQSNGANVDSVVSGSSEQTLTTRDSDISGSEYPGSLQREPDSGISAESSNDQSSAVGAPGSSVSGSGSSSVGTETLRGSGTADGAFHEPAAPVREGSTSEGWSSAGTFSGAGPGSVSGSTMANNDYAQDLYRRTQKDWSVRLGTDVPRSPGMTDRTVEEIDHARLYNDSAETNVGAPGGSVTGSESSDDSTCHADKGANGSSAQFEHGYREGSEDLDGSVRSSATPVDSDERLQRESSGAPGEAVTGSSRSVEGYPLRSSGSAVDSDERLQKEQDRYHSNPGGDGKYHINREASGDRTETSAPGGEYGDGPTKENYVDGHLNGNKAAGNSGFYDSSSSGADISQPGKSKADPGSAQGGDENSATTPE